MPSILCMIGAVGLIVPERYVVEVVRIIVIIFVILKTIVTLLSGVNVCPSMFQKMLLSPKDM